jgi:alkylhydroperoxidase family enzyme
MARIPLVDPERAAPEVAEALRALPASLGIFRLMAHAETCLRPLVALGTAILGRQQLDPKLRERAVLQAAVITPGRYEWVQHVPMARAVGVSEAEIEAVARSDWEAACFDETARLALRFGAHALGGAAVPDALFEAVATRLSPREIVELLLTLGYYSMLARLTEVTGLEIDAPMGDRILGAIRRP